MTDAPASTMIFAAGFGTRMGALTKDRPKPLISVAGKPLIDRCLDMVAASMPPQSPIVVNTHYKAEMMAAHLAQSPAGQHIQISHEYPEILDTGGGLKAALPKMGKGPIVTANPDAVWQGANPVSVALQHWDAHKMDALLVCVPLGRCVGRKGGGDFTLQHNGQLIWGGDVVFGGVHIISPHVFANHPETCFSLTAVWRELAKINRLAGVLYSGWWCDVGHPHGIPLAEELLTRDSF
jgi:MurNAc alpha-1-phosphate uridylyltransferase